MSTLNSLASKMGDVSLSGKAEANHVPYGKEMLKRFMFDPQHKNLNHGSFGAFPRVVQQAHRKIQDQCESRPDEFILYQYPKLLDESREVIAEFLNAPVSTIVYVPNATTGVNTVLRNLVWDRDGKDEILYFSTIYGACGMTVDYVCELNHNLVRGRRITPEYPIEDEDLLNLFKDAIKASKAEGKIPRVAIFDTISSIPGLRVPYVALTKICREEGVLSLIDGAHGVGQIRLDLSQIDPDFFVSNLHKWLYVPRGCAVFYVPERNQHLVRSPIPTSHGFVSKSGFPSSTTLPPSGKSEFVNNFEFLGTIDNTNYLMVAEALKFRKQVCGGEESIRQYCTKLAKEGGQLVADILGAEILDNSTRTLTECFMINLLLPLTADASKFPHTNVVKQEHIAQATQWMKTTLMAEYKTFIFVYFFQGRWWTRLSAQVYLDLSDFEWAGNTLKKLCNRVGDGEFLDGAKGVGKVVGNGELMSNGAAVELSS